MRNYKFFLNNSWWVYLLITLLTSFLLLIPLFITISLNSNIAAKPGNNPSLFLSINIPLLIVINLFIILYSIFQYRSFKFNFNFSEWIKKYFSCIIVSIAQTLLYFVLFMIIWLVPIDKTGNDIFESVVNDRVILYSVFASVLTLIFMLSSLYLNLYNKYLIKYKIQGNKSC